MKKLILFLILVPNVCFAQSLSLYGSWPNPQDVEVEYWPDVEVLPTKDGWETEVIPTAQINSVEEDILGPFETFTILKIKR